MLGDIHKRILKHIFVTWAVLTLLVGGGVYYLETEKIDDQVLELAEKEANSITPAIMQLLNAPPEQQGPLKAKVDELLKGRFVVVELYNHHRNSVAEGADAGDAALADEIGRVTHKFPFADTANYQKITIGNRLFLQVLLPLKETTGEVAGYFEGVYEVDPQSLHKIKLNMLGNVALSIVVTLVTTLILYPVILRLSRELFHFSGDLLRTNIELIEVLGSAIAKRDSDTNAHNYRVTLYAVRLAETLKVDEPGIRNLVAGAFLHDVGKIGISDAILLKPGRLTPEEFEVMKTHVTLGMDILAKSEWLQSARDVVEFHHEKYDGNGYPHGLKDGQIPLNARIFAVVDVFDALTSQRPYKAPMPFEQAMDILASERGKHFDPVVLDAFTRIARELFDQVNAANDTQIEAMMQHLAQHYFFDNAYLVEFLARHFKRHAANQGNQAQGTP